MNYKHLWLNRHTRLILHDLGLLLHVPGVMALVSLPICFWFGEYYAIGAFLWTTLASLGIGQLFYRLGSRKGRTRLPYAMLTVALAWGIIPFLGMIPFWAIASHLAAFPQTPPTVLEFQDFWNALFESFSGFTGTGLSVAVKASELPRSLQWWRSFIEWIDGIGVIVLVLSVLEPGEEATQLFHAVGRERKIALTVTATVQKMLWIYVLYTVLSILLLIAVGMPLWDAINNGLTGISTGGFSVRDDSIGAYSPLIQLALVPVMIAGAISFPIHYQLIKQRRLSVLWQDAQHRALWLLLGLGIVVLLLENRWFSGSFFWVDTVFQWVSALTTCGFNTVKLQTWSAVVKLLLTVAMVFGAASGSTVGGLKLKRIVFLYKGVLWRFQRLFKQPHELMRYQLNNKVWTEAEASREVESATILAILWITSLAMGVLVLLHVVQPQYTLSDVIFDAASALGNVGLSTGISAPELHWVGKLTLILLMWIGRLEIIPILVLVSSLLSFPWKTIRQR